MARDVDELSGGRFTLGLGAGCQEREHTNYGWDLLPLNERFERFKDSLEIISQLFNRATPVTYEVKCYHVRDAVLLPRPMRRVPILIGGRGPNRTLALTAQYANEWNCFLLSLDTYRDLNRRLDELLQANGRQSSDVNRSLMTGIVFGKDDAAVRGKLEERKLTRELVKERGLLCGTPAQTVEQLESISQAGAQRVMAQWPYLDDWDGVEAFAKSVLK